MEEVFERISLSLPEDHGPSPEAPHGKLVQKNPSAGSADEQLQHVVFVVNPSVNNIFTGVGGRLASSFRDASQLRYAYAPENGVFSPLWVSKFRFIVIDLAAEGAMYAPLDASEGAVTPAVFPKASEPPAAVLGKLTNIVTEAIERVFLPDVTFCSVSPAKLLLAPLVDFRNHDSLGGIAAQLKEVVAKMHAVVMPKTIVKAVTAAHRLEHHSHVATALARATRHVNAVNLEALGQQQQQDVFHPHTVPSLFVDAGRLIVDMPVRDLARQLLEEVKDNEEARNLKESFFGEASANMDLRIYPVYIFTLVGRSRHECFLENYERSFASENGVVVLRCEHDGVAVRFFNETSRWLLKQNLTQAVGGVLSGLLRGLGNVAPSHLKWSEAHNRTVVNYLFSASNAFGSPFCDVSAVEIPQWLRWSAIRANVIAWLDHSLKLARSAMNDIAAFEDRHLPTPKAHMAVVGSHLAFSMARGAEETNQDVLQRQLKAGGAVAAAAKCKIEIKQLQNLILQVSQALRTPSHSASELAAELGSELPRLANKMRGKVEHILKVAEAELTCCSWNVRVRRKFDWLSVLVVVAFFVCLAGVALWVIVKYGYITTTHITRKR